LPPALHGLTAPQGATRLRQTTRWLDLINQLETKSL